MPVNQPNLSLNLREPHNESFCDQGHSILKESCKACELLKKDWYSYLTRSGFEDIEKGLRLARPTEQLNLRMDFSNQTTFEAKRNYYAWAQECLTLCSFDSMIDRMIWQYHSEGYSSREIGPIVGYERSWIPKKLKVIESKLKAK